MSSLADHAVSGPDRDPSVAALVEQLYHSHAGLVRSVCRSILRDRVEAEDAAQQTFLSAQRALMNGSLPQDAAAWLATIARNESLTRVRARMREPIAVDIEERAAAPDVYVTASQRYEASELRGALAQLPPEQREAIFLREVRGLSSREVAAALSVTPHAAESLVFRARRRLRTQLQGALAGLSPGLFVQLRKLAASAANGGLVAPPAAKVAAVGVGAMLVTGGALVGPRALGLGHGLQPFRSAASASVRSAAPEASLRLSPNLTPQSLHNRAVLDSDHARPVADSDPIRRAVSVGQASSDISGTPAGAQGSAATQDAASNGDAQQNSPGSTDAPQRSSSNAGSTDSGSSNSQGSGNSGDSQSGTTSGDSGQGD
jgi:RNA polymerase sigma-70 factor (ECF subfamily)